METWATIIGNIVILVICLVSVLSGYLFYKLDKRHKHSKKTIKKLCKQLQAYWCVEKLYAEEMAKKIGKPYSTVLKDFREKGTNHQQNYHAERPSFTSNHVEKIIRNS